MAKDLVKRLATAGIRGRVAGQGVHWHVDVESAGTRAVIVHCFWYDRGIHGLMLGLNPANARSRLRAARAPYEGPEYYTIVRDGGVDVADGRTHEIDDAVAAARAWLEGTDLEQLARAVPFIDQKGRAMRALASRIDPALRRTLGRDPTFELWIYGQGRSCKLAPEDDDSISCAFLLGQAQIARAAHVDDAPAIIAAWLVEGLPLRLLATRVPGVALERHAEVLETDPARWHWLHFRDRIADPRDVLAPLRPLIEALATSPVATRFYTYSSLHMLCFSASSHYPWVDDGLPVVWPVEQGVYLVGDNAARRIADDVARTATRCDLSRAVPLIEGMLAASRFQPVFGSRPHRDLPLLSDCFARQGSKLQPRLVQTGAWYNLEVADAADARSCTMSELSATFEDEAGFLSAAWPTIDDAVRAVRRYLEDGATLDQVAVDPLAQHVVRRPATPS